MIKTITICLGLYLCFALLSCEKDTVTLTSKQWKVAKTDKYTSNNPKSENIMYLLTSECVMDDIYTFTADGQMTINTGAKKCTPDDQGVTFTYSLDEANGTITIGGSAFDYFGIHNGQLKYGIKIPAAVGSSYTYMINLLE
jgi:hypothetical protein